MGVRPVAMNLQVLSSRVVVDTAGVAHREVLHDAVSGALEDAGLTRHDLDTGASVTSDLAEGRGLSNQFTLDALGGVMRPFDLRLTGDSLLGLSALATHLLSGAATTAVVATLLRASDLRGAEDRAGLIRTRLDPFYEQPILARAGGDLPSVLDRLLGDPVDEAPQTPPRDVAVAAILRRTDVPVGVSVRSIAWHTRPGWAIEDYRANVERVVVTLGQRVGTDLGADLVSVPAGPAPIREASLRALSFADGADLIEGPGGNELTDGLERFALTVKELARRPVGTRAIVQSWQGRGTSSVCAVVLENAGGAA